ncbi:MAG TPA: hypothetical protein VLE27_02895, partial [Thermoanaerobaculia bacterium]|nr:hypothetical protein [Thermoanaerobaculia bacterium]
IQPRPFHSRGAPLVLLLHPWSPTGQPVPISLERSVDASRDLIARLPAGLATGDVLSFELLRPASGKPTTAVLLQPGGPSLPLQLAGRRRVKARFLTPRFRYTAGTNEIRLPASARINRRRLELRLWRWSPAACPRESTL